MGDDRGERTDSHADEPSVPADYYPGEDAEFHAWLWSFVADAGANLAGLGPAACDPTPLATA